MPKAASSQLSASEWQRMSGKVVSSRNNVESESGAASSSKNTNILSRYLGSSEFQPEIENILEYRQINGIDQYMASWKVRNTDDYRTTWEVEKVIEKVCREALIKYWIKTHIGAVPEKRKDGESSSKKDFSRKLYQWAMEPVPSVEESSDLKGPVSSTLVTSTTPSKKRPRLEISDDESTDTDCQTQRCERKLRKRVLKSGVESNHFLVSTHMPASSSHVDEDPSNRTQYTDRLQNLLNSNEISGLIDTPECEIGEVISTKQASDSDLNSYLVAWNYVGYETAETLGLDNDLLKNLCSSKIASHTKFQLQRKKYGTATIKTTPIACNTSSKVSLSSSRSESDLSEASTHPPGYEDCPEIKEEQFDDNSQIVFGEPTKKIEAACQTSVELDPYACPYCQSRRGERSSNRNRKVTIKVEEAEQFKKAEKLIELNTTEVTEPTEDDELVDIEYEVEHIVDYRKAEGTNVDEFYIKWKGFTAQYNTWEPDSNLSCCDKALIIFYVNRVFDRRTMEIELARSLTQNGNGTVATSGKRVLNLPPIPPMPEIIMEHFKKVAPITDAEIEMAFKLSKTVRKNSRWPKKKLRKLLLDLIGEPPANGTTSESGISQSELPIMRHQILMLEGERRKELVAKDLKKWENHLNWIAQGKPEIIVENHYDLAGPPTDFKYINDNIIGEGVNFPDDTLEGCDCEDTCMKDKSHCCPGKHGKVLAYNSYKRLRVLPGYPIYECNKRCKCGPECTNRVVQDGTISLIGTKLCIFRTSNERGWGVKTLRKIKKGSFVCLYAGEIITTEEAESRGEVYEKQLGASYLFDMDYWTTNNGGGSEIHDSCPYTVDATKMGNISHFINHSCDPNLSVFNVWADCVDQNLPKLAFFALREINKDEELTYDYGSQDDEQTMPTANSSTSTACLAKLPPLPNGEPDPEDDMDNEIDPALLTSSPAKNRMKLATAPSVRRACLCGARNCRKVLF